MRVRNLSLSVGADISTAVILILAAGFLRMTSASESTTEQPNATSEQNNAPSTCNTTAWLAGTTHTRANSLLVDFPFESELHLSQPDDGDLCGGQVSCCPRDLQQRLVGQAPHAMRQKLRFIDEYHEELTKFDKNFKEAYTNALAESREHTLYTLHTDLKFFRHNDSVDVFYRKLQLYLTDPPVQASQELSGHHIETAVQQLFADLFISVFHQLANPRLRDFSADYATCLRRQTSSLQPFGDNPQRLGTYFAKSFQAAHLFMRSTRYLSEILRTAANMNVTNHSECTQALGSLFYCPTCRGLYDLEPCNSLCLNVMRGCLAPLSDLDTPWSNLVDKTIQLLKRSQETNYEVEHALLILPRRLIDAVQYAMDNGIEVVKRVRANCGEPQGSIGSADPIAQHRPSSIRRSSSPTSLLTGPTKTLEGLTTRLHVKLLEIRGLLGALSEQLCPSPANTNCWTGAEKGSYRKATAGRGITAQRLNPEVSFNEHQTPNYVPLVNYSVQMKRMAIEMASAGVMKIHPESDNYQGIETRQQKAGVHEGSGDLEGSADFEGSGSGAGPEDDTEADNEQDSNVAVMRSNFNASIPTTTESAKPNSGASRSARCRLLDVVLLATTIIAFRTYQ